SILYLGPYFNLLPVVAICFMYVQQRMMTPPPTDEQGEMQQKMSKYMMIFMAIMFFKVAAGLCLYFIASSLWGFAERKFLRKKPAVTPGAPAPEAAAPKDGLVQKALERFNLLGGARPGSESVTSSPTDSAGTAVTPAPASPGGSRPHKNRPK